jgi:iron complex outermembrane receptor protein
VVQNPANFLQRLDWGLSYTYHDFQFKNYVNDGNDYSGNELTGVAPHTIVSTLNARTAPGLYGNLSYNFTDEIPLNDANTVYSNAYHLVQTKIGYKREVAKSWTLDFFIGIDNLLDEKYSLGNDLNAFGDRFYQPAAPRNWFGGVKVTYGF